MEGEEYPDDFEYAQLLHALVLGESAPPPGPREILGRLEKATDGEATPRSVICRALLDKDQNGFDKAVADLIEERVEEYASDPNGLRPDPDRFDTEKALFIEGLALLRIGESRGLRTAKEYRFMPDLARL
jgi:hypothetical protein